MNCCQAAAGTLSVTSARSAVSRRKITLLQADGVDRNVTDCWHSEGGSGARTLYWRGIKPMYESATLHFDLGHLESDQPFTLHAGARQYDLAPHTAHTRNLARRENA